MKDLRDLLEDHYNNQQDQWEKTLKSELKIEDIGNKTSKNYIGIGKWPTLSIKSTSESSLSSNEWKKASQTYVKFGDRIEADLLEDLNAGVRLFFLYSNNLSVEVSSKIKSVFTQFTDKKEIEVVLLGLPKKFDLGVTTFTTDDYNAATEVEKWGGDSIQELALITLRIIESQKSLPIAVYVDSHFFKNIAKIRAAKLLALKVFEELGIHEKPQVIALNSYREWTLFERYSNMLRNNAQVASALVAGAEYVQSSGYEIIFDLETNYESIEHDERSLRMARNTGHILSLESMLGIVQDAAYGSFHLENLTEEYAQKAWALMQELIVLDPDQRVEKLKLLCNEVAKTRQMQIETRKVVLAGMNDFPDGKERLNVELKKSEYFRVSRKFEELRINVSKLKNLPKVYIVLKGDYAALNGRVNFIKNYFELIGLEVIDPLSGKTPTENDVVVFCAKDEDYPDLISKSKDKFLKKYVAGKVEIEGSQMIHAGQNVYSVLSELVSEIQGGN